MGFEIQPCAGQADLLNKIGIDEIMLGGDFAVVPAVVPFKIRSASMTATRKPLFVSSYAVVRPVIPPPITAISHSVSSVRAGKEGMSAVAFNRKPVRRLKK